MSFKQFLDLFYTVAQTMTSWFVLIVYLTAAVFIYFWNKRKYTFETASYGYSNVKPLKDTFTSSLEGFLGGLIATFIVTILGIVVNQNQITIAIFISIIIGNIRPNLMNIIYSCCIVALFSSPKEAYSLIAIGAVMVLVQGILILISGYRDSIAVVMKTSDGENFGGYIDNKIWPVSLGIIVFVSQQVLNSSQNIPTPHWWPIFDAGTSGIKGLIYMVLPLLTFCVNFKSIYSDTKNRKRIISGVSYFVYGVVIITLSFLFKINNIVFYLLDFLAMASYVMCDILTNDSITTKYKKFVGKDKVVVLDVISSTLAQYADIKPLDKIISINDIKEYTIEGYNKVIHDNLKYKIELERQGRQINVDVQIQIGEGADYSARPRGLYDIGIIAVPASENTENINSSIDERV